MRLLLASLVAVVLFLTLYSVDGRRHRGQRRTMRDNRHQRSHGEEESGRRVLREWRNRAGQRFGSNEKRYAVDFMDKSSGHPYFSFDMGWTHGPGHDSVPWWNGPNVCESETEERKNDTNTRHEMLRHFMTTSQTCDASETAYKCKYSRHTMDGRLEVTVVKQCCHGYKRTPGHTGCLRRVEMFDLLKTVQNMGLTDFERAVRLLHLTRELKEGNFTVFAPVNGAFGLDSDIIDTEIMVKDQPIAISVSGSIAERAVEDLQDAILGHMVAGTETSSMLEDEQILETGNPEGSIIRINYFSNPRQVMMANCIEVKKRDEMATNGVIHTVASVIKPVTETLLDLVRTREDLSVLKTVLALAEYVPTLNNKASLTLLAPTNAAFERMNPRLRDRLMRGDIGCIQKVLLNHLLPNVICSGAIHGDGRTPNLLHKYINVNRTADGKVFLNGAQVLQADLMATNGVMHVIDDVIVPIEALGVVDVLEKNGFTELLSLVEKAGLSKTLDEANNITIFAPTNEAIKGLPEILKSRLISNPELLREVISFHVSPGIQECQRYHDNQKLPTLAGTDIRINSYRPFLFHNRHSMKTAQCVPAHTLNVEACNGKINVIEDVMLPPKGNVIDVLALDKKFSTLVSLIKKAGIADSLQGNGPFTIFAPNNEAFQYLDGQKLEAIKKDPEQLKDLLNRHVFENTLCCAGITRGSWFAGPQVRVMSGDIHKLTRDRVGKPKVSHAHVVTCDRTATNGNVLELDSVLVRPSERNWRYNPFASRQSFWP